MSYGHWSRCGHRESCPQAESNTNAPMAHKHPRDPSESGQLFERSTGYRAPIANMVDPPYRAPIANMIEPPYRAPFANMIELPYRAPVANMAEPPYRAPVANMGETPYRAPNAHMYPYEQSDCRKDMYRGCERTTTYGLAAGQHRPSERVRDGYSSRERTSSGAVRTSGGRREPSYGSHSYENSGDRYGDRYRNESTEPHSTYRGW